MSPAWDRSEIRKQTFRSKTLPQDHRAKKWQDPGLPLKAGFVTCVIYCFPSNLWWTKSWFSRRENRVGVFRLLTRGFVILLVPTWVVTRLGLIRSPSRHTFAFTRKHFPGNGRPHVSLCKWVKRVGRREFLRVFFFLFIFSFFNFFFYFLEIVRGTWCCYWW